MARRIEVQDFSVTERFLRYVKIDTQSDDSAKTVPSTKKQLDLIHLLQGELVQMGLEEVSVSPHGMLTATLPANNDVACPTIGFFAHVDTSPDVSGKSVTPIIHENYKGGEIVLPKNKDQTITPDSNPELKKMVGEDIITSSGATLLGADDKAGIAEIMDALTFFVSNPDITHGKVKVAFTVDEETGQGIRNFDVKKFGADYAYTLDGGKRGEIETESFSADAMEVTFFGRNIHPGYAKDKMINAVKVAAEFLSSLPKDTLSPETTEKREGYIHPQMIEGNEEEAHIKFIIRDFDTDTLKEYEEKIDQLAKHTCEKYPGSQYKSHVSHTYKNMKEVLDNHPRVKSIVEEAMSIVGLKPFSNPIRGGTDGSQLSFMGLPTANIFAGEHNFHSKTEFTSRQEMEDAVKVVVNLVYLWSKEKI